MPRKQKPARLYQRKDDGAWVILDGGKQIRTGFGRELRAEAEKALSRYISEKTLKDTTTVDLRDITIGEVLSRYGEAKVGSVKDPERLVNTIKALGPYWANKTAADIMPEVCRGYVKWRGKAAWTVRREMTTLNAALRYAALRRRIPYAPPVELPPKGSAKDRWLTRDEARNLLGASAPHLQRFIKIALATGRRKSAILGLKWVPSVESGWVDLQHGVVHFLGLAEEETKKRKGIVRIPQGLLDEMKTWAQDGLFVVSPDGDAIANIRKAFDGAVKRAGLTDVTPHTLKHTAVTWAFMNGMTLEQAVDFFAASRETLEDVYRSYSPEGQKEAA